MRCACIDIGTNTTRVLVADVAGGRLVPLLQRRAFTRIGESLSADGSIGADAVADVCATVAEQRALAEQAGAACVRTVATAAIRAAPNRAELLEALRARAGVEPVILSGEDEARLAFAGATRTFGPPLPGRVAVVDVGGGSTEVALGAVQDGADWSASFPLGSSRLTARACRSDPPTARDVAAMRADARAALSALAVPRPDAAVAVGGSAASLRRVVGERLDAETLDRALGTLRSAPAAHVAERLGIDPQRARLLPAGILLLDAAAERLGRPLLIGRGGLREGVVLALAKGSA